MSLTDRRSIVAVVHEHGSILTLTVEDTDLLL